MNIRRMYLGCISGPLGPATPFNGYLIEHPKGLTLVDTGFGTTLLAADDAYDPGVRAGELHWGEKRFPWFRRTTVEALADHGIEPGDVKYIINTHVGDHAGDNHLFPNATFIIQQPEVEYGRRRYDSRSRAEWDFPGAKMELLQSEDVEVLPGVTCLFTPGHTPGHQSVLYQADGRSVLFCGDAVYTEDIWNDPDQINPESPILLNQVTMGAEGLDLWRASVAKLAALKPEEVHFAHDHGYLHRGRRHLTTQHRHAHGP